MELFFLADLYVSGVAWCCLREIAYVHIVKWKFKILHKHTNTITRVTYIGMHIASCSYHTNTHCHIISHCIYAEKKRKKTTTNNNRHLIEFDEAL